MCRRRYEVRHRRTAWARGLTGALAVAALAAAARAGEGHRRVVPANALPLPGANSAGYPAIGLPQITRIGEEVIVSSLGSILRAPFDSAGQVFGRSVERLTVRARELSTWVVPPRPCRHGHPCGCDLGGCAGGPPLPARLTLLPSSEAAIQALFGLIATAERRIDLMIYGWEDDPTGREVARALADRASQGVRIRLLVDRAGFLMHNAAAAEGRCTFLDELQTVPNVSVIEPPDPFFRFDHRKLAVIDGRVAWTGGMILTEVARRHWQNLAFLAEGPVVTEYAGVFEERWNEVGGPPEFRDSPEVPDPSVAPNATVRLVQTDVRTRTLKEALFHAVDHARNHIYLTNPYFSDTMLAAKLVEAQTRGVDVRVVLTMRGNSEYLNRYVILTANRLLRGGVRVYLAPAMTHVKAMSVDGVWAYIGTGNFDELSLRNNREVGLSVTSSELVRELDGSIFLRDMAISEELHALMPCPKNWVKLELMSLWF